VMLEPEHHDVDQIDKTQRLLSGSRL
jgi:hypothetical protein